MFLVSSCSCLCPIHWSQVFSRDWRCSCSNADRQCSNYIWVIKSFIACWYVSCIADWQHMGQVTKVRLSCYAPVPLSRMLSATNTNWHPLHIAQHRIDLNYFILVRCHFRISSQPNTNVLKCSKHSYWPCESILFVLRRIASPNVVSIRVSSYLILVHSYRFVVHSHWDSPPVCCDSVRCNTMRNDRIVVLDHTCSHWFL